MTEHCEDYELVDISMWMDDFTFPGDSRVEVRGPFNVLAGANPEFVYEFSAPTQAGTHIQGPHYFLEHGARIDAFPLHRFEGWAHLVDIAGRGRDTTLEELRVGIGATDLADRILLLRTGHMEEVIADGWLDPARRPGLSLEAATWLAEESGVHMVAIDSVGLESRETSDFDVNVLLCGNDILILEGLVNLDGLRDERLWLQAFPLKLRGVEGAPCRAVLKVHRRRSDARSPR